MAREDKRRGARIVHRTPKKGEEGGKLTRSEGENFVHQKKMTGENWGGKKGRTFRRPLGEVTPKVCVPTVQKKTPRKPWKFKKKNLLQKKQIQKKGGGRPKSHPRLGERDHLPRTTLKKTGVDHRGGETGVLVRGKTPPKLPKPSLEVSMGGEKKKHHQKEKNRKRDKT